MLIKIYTDTCELIPFKYFRLLFQRVGQDYWAVIKTFSRHKTVSTAAVSSKPYKQQHSIFCSDKADTTPSVFK